LESLDCTEAEFLFQDGPPKVSLMALLCEKGDGSENDGVLPETIKADTDLDRELHGFLFKEMMDWSHFRDHVWHDSEQWWNVEFRQDVRRRAAGLKEVLRWRREAGDWPERPTEGECVVFFTHWGFAKEVSGMDMANFGKDSKGDPQKLDRHAILEKLAPGKGWSCWRKSGQYEEVLHQA
jgi:hypothetical protein